MGRKFSTKFHSESKIFEAYFLKGQNLADQNKVIRLVSEVGLPIAEVVKILEKRTYKDAVDLDWLRSQQIGINGVPTFVIGQNWMLGAHTYEVLERFIVENPISMQQS